jgi:hypothetical protein
LIPSLVAHSLAAPTVRPADAGYSEHKEPSCFVDEQMRSMARFKARTLIQGSLKILDCGLNPYADHASNQVHHHICSCYWSIFQALYTPFLDLSGFSEEDAGAEYRGAFQPM